MTMIKKISASLLIGTMAFALAACGKEEKPVHAPSLVTGEVIHKKEIPINYEYAARIVSYRETQVRARVGGILLHRNFVEGSEVKQGDVLFEIDPDTYEALVASARAQVAQAQANYDQSIRDANRAEELLVKKVQSTAQRDQAFATRDANLANLMQAKAQLRTAELNLEYTKVTAPISGLTSREAVSEGSLIGTDSTSSLLTTITQRDPVYVNFSFSDSESTEMKRLMAEMKARGEDVSNLKIKVFFGDGTQYPEEGTVDFTSPTIDEQTGTLGARAVIENPDHRLVPGMFVRVTVIGLKMANATIVPEATLMQTSSGQSIFVLKKPEEAKNAAEKGAESAPTLEPGAHLMEVEQRPVKVIRQLQTGEWLLAPAETYQEEVPVTPDTPAAPAKDQTAATQPTTPPAMKKVERIRGVQDGDEVVTDGIIYIQQGLTTIPQGQKLHVQVKEAQSTQTDATGAAKAVEPAQ